MTGGQRTFGPSALNAVRITGLYADTQLIPDPIYPFVGSNLSLNAVHLQLAIQLFYVLRLRPLVEAELPVPPSSSSRASKNSLRNGMRTPNLVSNSWP